MSLVENPSQEKTGFIDMSKIMSPAAFGKHRGYAYEHDDPKVMAELQDDLAVKADTQF